LDVVDSCLHVIGSGNGEAGNGGDVIYDKKLSNFELSLIGNIKSGNSGVFILAQEFQMNQSGNLHWNAVTW